MSLVSIQQDSTLFKQGSVGNFFFIVQSGSLELSIDNKSIKAFSKGDSFGELSLLHGDARSGTVVASEESYLWCLSRNNFRKIIDRVNRKSYEENRRFVEKIPILSMSDSETKNEICSSILKENFKVGDYILRQGDSSNCIYMIEEGQVDVYINKEKIRTLKKGDQFGEVGILTDQKRSSDIVATKETVCYAISVTTFKKLFGEGYRDVLYKNLIRNVFERHAKLSKLNEKTIDTVFSKFEIRKYDKMDVVLEKNARMTNMFIVVIEGGLINYRKREILAKRGEILFEDIIFDRSEEKMKYDLKAYPDCMCAVIPTAQLIDLLGGQDAFTQLITESDLLSILDKVSIFKNLTKDKQKRLAQALRPENYNKGRKIIQQNSQGRSLYIVKEGSVDIFVNFQYIRTLSEGEYFGERTLFFSEPRSATAQAKGNATVYKLSKEDFDSIIDTNIKSIMKERLALQDERVQLRDLDVLGKLGSGSFGRVFLVKNRRTKHEYALKCISRGQIDEEGLHENLQMERDIQLKIDHPLIVKLVKCMKDKYFIYLLMENIKGTDLFSAIREIGLLNSYQTKFYAASMLIIIEYLRERKIVYRDIKPENMMVDEKGYLKMIDFGTAKEVPHGRTYTIIGTPHYMAPEIILGKGYSFSVDVWSIGVWLNSGLHVRISLWETTFL